MANINPLLPNGVESKIKKENNNPLLPATSANNSVAALSAGLGTGYNILAEQNRLHKEQSTTPVAVNLLLNALQNPAAQKKTQNEILNYTKLRPDEKYSDENYSKSVENDIKAARAARNVLAQERNRTGGIKRGIAASLPPTEMDEEWAEINTDIASLKRERSAIENAPYYTQLADKIAAYESIAEDTAYSDLVNQGRQGNENAEIIEDERGHIKKISGIDNKVTFLEQNYDRIERAMQAASINQNVSNTLNDIWRLRFLTQDEKNIYSALLARGGGEEAEGYLDSLERALNRRVTEENQAQAYDAAYENGIEGFAGSVLTGLGSGMSLLDTAGNAIGNLFRDTKVPADAYSNMHQLANQSTALRQGTLDQIDSEFGKFMAEAGMSIAQIAALAPLGPTGMIAVMSSSAGGQAATAGLQAGMTSEQAALEGIKAAALEAATERIPVNRLFKLARTSAGSAKQLISQIGKQGLIEGTEEFANNVLNAAVDKLVNNGWGEYDRAVEHYIAEGYSAYEAEKLAGEDFIKETGRAFALGAVAGTATGGVASAAGFARNGGFDVQDSNIDQQAKTTTEQTAARLAEALNIPVQMYAGEANGQNGFYNNGTIYINTQSENPIASIFAHELTHSLEVADAYQDLQGMILTRLAQDGTDIASLRQQTAESYANAGIELQSEADIDAEIVARFVEEKLLTDEATIIKMAQTDRNLVQRILDWINNTLAKITGNKEKQFLNEAKSLYSKALAETQPARVQNILAFSHGMPAIAQQNNPLFGHGQYSLNNEFTKQVDQWLNSKDADQRIEDYGHFTVGSTSDALKSIGMKDSNIYWRKSKMQQIIEDHPEMSWDIIKQVPQVLENPVMVLKSKTRDDSIVLLGELYAKNGKPVLAALQLTPKAAGKSEAEFALLTSAYVKDNAKTLVENSDILYINPDKNRTNTLLMSIRVQFPSDQQVSGSIGTITYSDGKVNIEGVPFSELGNNAKYSISDNSTRNISDRTDIPPENNAPNEMELREQRDAIDEYFSLAGDLVQPIMPSKALAEEKILTRVNKEKQTAKEAASDAYRYLKRKMADSGEAVARIGKAAEDKSLYEYYNFARASRNAAISMINDAQTNIKGEQIGKGLNDIFNPIRAKGDNCCFFVKAEIGQINSFGKSSHLLNEQDIGRKRNCRQLLLSSGK